MRLHEALAQPEWKLDNENKVYIVHDETGKEVSRHKFEHVWNSSPARDAAQKEVNQLKVALRNKQHAAIAATAEAKPLSSLEKEYIELHTKITQSFKDLKAGKPTLSHDEINKIENRLARLGNSMIIRKSVLDGTRTS